MREVNVFMQLLQQRLATPGVEQISDPEIEQRDENHVIVTFPASNSEAKAGIEIRLEMVCEDDDGTKHWDAALSVDNCEMLSPVEMLSQSVSAVQRFYDLGLNTRWGHIVGDPL